LTAEDFDLLVLYDVFEKEAKDEVERLEKLFTNDFKSPDFDFAH